MKSLAEQVQQAVAAYGDLPQVPFSSTMSDEDAFVATPDRLAWALAWIAANAVVGARFATNGIDALPIYHPESGWDRFLLTRRMTANQFAQESANRYGMLMVDGADAPRLVSANDEERMTLGAGLQAAPEETIAAMLEQVRQPELGTRDLGYRWKDRQRIYPTLYNVVTDLILDYPGFVVAREIFVDVEPVDGVYHPLYLHSVTKEPALIYDWFMVRYGERTAFFRAHGGYSVYQTNRGGWSTVRRQLADDDAETIRGRIMGWLRMDGREPGDGDGRGAQS